MSTKQDLIQQIQTTFPKVLGPYACPPPLKSKTKTQLTQILECLHVAQTHYQNYSTEGSKIPNFYQKWQAICLGADLGPLTSTIKTIYNHYTQGENARIKLYKI